MATTAATSVAITTGAASGVLAATFDLLIDPWNPRLAAGVLLGSLIYLLRVQEEQRIRRLCYFALSLPLGYIASFWIIGTFPGAPAGLIGCASGALIVVVASAVFDGMKGAMPGIVSSVATALKERLTNLIGGSRD